MGAYPLKRAHEKVRSADPVVDRGVKNARDVAALLGAGALSKLRFVTYVALLALRMVTSFRLGSLWYLGPCAHWEMDSYVAPLLLVGGPGKLK